MAFPIMPIPRLMARAPAPPMTAANVTPAAPAGLSSSSTVTTTATVNIVGGTGPFTYNWVKISGDNITVTATAANPATFRAASMSSGGEVRTAIFRCTVTDTASGQTINTANITVKLERFAF